jgi:hypothetical protein
MLGDADASKLKVYHFYGFFFVFFMLDFADAVARGR